MKKFYIITVSRGSLLYTLTVIVLLAVVFVLAVPVLYTGMVQVYNQENPADSDQQAVPGGKLAIVIDDFGSSRQGVEDMMSIKEHLTFAVMPFLENTLEDAEIAHGKGYEVIVHLSMEPNYGKRSWLGPRPIMAGMKAEEVREIVRAAFDSVPYAAGANIHMGSKASNDENIMSTVLNVINEKNLYFIDSRTASRPKAKKLADTKGIVCFERDVFLDEQQPKSVIKQRLEAAADIALKKGYAIAAGHVGSEGGKVTAEAIREMLPELKRKNIELVYISELNEAISIQAE